VFYFDVNKDFIYSCKWFTVSFTVFKGSFHLWKVEYVFKMGNLCRRNV